MFLPAFQSYIFAGTRGHAVQQYNIRYCRQRTVLTCKLKCTMRCAASVMTRFWGWLRRGPRVSSCHSGFAGCRSLSLTLASWNHFNSHTSKCSTINNPL